MRDRPWLGDALLVAFLLAPIVLMVCLGVLQ